MKILGQLKFPIDELKIPIRFAKYASIALVCVSCSVKNEITEPTNPKSTLNNQISQPMTKEITKTELSRSGEDNLPIFKKALINALNKKNIDTSNVDITIVKDQELIDEFFARVRIPESRIEMHKTRFKNGETKLYRVSGILPNSISPDIIESPIAGINCLVDSENGFLVLTNKSLTDRMAGKYPETK
jgi:hypothetical protein